MTTPPVTLDHDGWTLVVLPSLGGAIGALRHHGNEVLRPAPPHNTDVLATACFPLVPYANRIANGQFEFAGEVHQLPLNFDDHPHSLHGLGWQVPWSISDAGEGHVVMTHSHDGGPAWPWPYRVIQRITLASREARIDLSLTNTADAAVPVGLGLHPYFPRTDATRLTFDAERLRLTDQTVLPTVPAPAQHFAGWAEGAFVKGSTLIDNAYEGWSGTARIDQSWGSVTIGAEDAPVLHLYRPPNEDFFCVEPVSHLPDAINRNGMDSLQPGATQHLRMTLSV